MNKIINYIKNCYNELVYKVTWPKRSELSSSAVLVMIASIILALVIFVIDFVFQHAIDFIYKI